MAENGCKVVDRVVQEEIKGTVDWKKNAWIIPDFHLEIPVGK
jgi:hypothetical protein